MVADRNSPQKHVWRAAIVLATADGLGTNAIMRQTGKSKTAVRRWQERFAEEGVGGLLRDKTRPPRIAPTSTSWLNAVEGFFAALTKRRLRRGIFLGVVDLQAAINLYLTEHNTDPKPFKWNADPDGIIASAARGHQTLDSIH